MARCITTTQQIAERQVSLTTQDAKEGEGEGEKGQIPSPVMSGDTEREGDIGCDIN